MKKSLAIILGLAGLALLVIGGVYLTNNPTTNMDQEIVFEESEHDFGVIKQSGGIVTREFPFVYNGTEERNVTNVLGSCACTTAEIDVDVLKPGTRGTITVSFDPNLHEEPEGRFYKTVSLLTDPVLPEDAEVKIWQEIDLDLGPEHFKLSSNNDGDEHVDEHTGQKWGEIHADELQNRLTSKDFYLVDVHTPEQEHIPGTDAVIPYDELAQRLNELPDKDKEIILYCRSGSMSITAAETLTDNGFTNVSYLEGGIKAFNELELK